MPDWKCMKRNAFSGLKTKDLKESLLHDDKRLKTFMREKLKQKIMENYIEAKSNIGFH